VGSGGGGGGGSSFLGSNFGGSVSSGAGWYFRLCLIRPLLLLNPRSKNSHDESRHRNGFTWEISCSSRFAAEPKPLECRGQERYRQRKAVSAYIDLKSLSIASVNPCGRSFIGLSSKNLTMLWYFLLVLLKYVGSLLISRASSAIYLSVPSAYISELSGGKSRA
jgi:hypothetical protein